MEFRQNYRVKSNDQVKLYIRLPVKIVDEQQIKSLHPSISYVRLARQKSARWCFIYFETPEALSRAREDLKKLDFEGKRLRIAAPRKDKFYKKKAEQAASKQAKQKQKNKSVKIKQEVKKEPKPKE